MFSACGVSEKINTFSGSTMGTTYTVKTIGDNGISQQKIDDRLTQINQIFSTWDAKSELSAVNQQSVNEWIKVSDELFYVLKTAKEIHQQTEGYFDPGIGNLVDVWGFGANKQIQKPSQIEVYKAFINSSIRYLTLKDGVNKAVKKTRDIYIDLSAIAKGYGVDAIVKLLNTQNYLVEIGGEVRSGGSNNGKPWMVGVEHPSKATPIAITLNNQAIATSGNYRHYFIWQGKRYMHILNPHTGLPANSDLASVSIIHPQTMVADAYATAMMAMGSQRATALAKQLGLPVILILNQQAHFKVTKINL
ncbi:FAD:protein FMN transferase (EC 2.7.1.180) [uncultured Gammaproteobacteria bacterium]|nr:FAD:protein FMN transferase (EC 2.7.1.180) [uncultured Gammaproteobacteria bacterium]CAC9513288.1 FAD:protein FMN transferase (EC 2.7.1.180) [uncultured Gammaproteobacteria bacterium]CAC9516732.1 FAD:protein FMN transferase (EC 2.7.1.180) [uncultured Gammaproteobacteria bacterium]CAC9524606.1 FAD:protein FMN transferase (EC 2.7.1.180) [uncultured Gammaproteobacteria bacterium]CAC9526003.1 FAD:protein FMN transferase (EC 2.7.1.180) [uncultured Gammaproteobacteria bacterium]